MTRIDEYDLIVSRRKNKLTKDFFKTTTPPLPLYLELKCDDAGGLTAGPQDVLVSGQVVRLGDLSGFVEEVRTGL